MPGTADPGRPGTCPPPVAPRWLIKLCKPSRVRWLAPLLGFLLTLPSVLSGYVQDDHLLRQHSLDSTVFARRPAWDYYNGLASEAEVARYRERGVAQVTWWTPDMARSRFFRPAASLLHAFEFRYLDSAPWVMHIHRALLYALIAFLCFELFSRFSTTPVACGIAALLFAIDDAHAYSSGWISAANTLLTCAFGLFALLMHDRWRRRRSKVGLLLSLGAFVLSLSSSEGGLALLGYLVAYELFLATDSRWKRAAALTPVTLVAAGYLVFYAVQHFGVTGSFDYLSPTEDLGQTALVLLKGTLTGTAGQILSLPMLTMILQMRGGALVAIVLLVALAAILWRFVGASKTTAFFGTGMVLSIVPFAMGMMGDRYLLWSGFGAAGLLGELFAVHTPTGRLQRITVKTLFVTNTFVSLVFFIPTLFWLAPIEGNIRKLESIVTLEDTVILNGHPLADSCAAAIRYEKRAQWPEHFYHLYDGMEAVTVKRTAERTLLVTPESGWFSSSPFSRGARPKELDFKQGQAFDLRLMTARIEAITEDGRPSSVSFAFKEDLAKFAWLQLTLAGPRRIQAPAPGQELRVNPWSR